MDVAYAVAQRLTTRIGQQKMQVTHDKIPWWLTGLTEETSRQLSAWLPVRSASADGVASTCRRSN